MAHRKDIFWEERMEAGFQDMRFQKKQYQIIKEDIEIYLGKDENLEIDEK